LSQRRYRRRVSLPLGDFVGPPVFTSSNGVLNLLMVAPPPSVPGLIYVPPNNALATSTATG
jgi:hypothetical protein